MNDEELKEDRQRAEDLAREVGGHVVAMDPPSDGFLVEVDGEPEEWHDRDGVSVMGPSNNGGMLIY